MSAAEFCRLTISVIQIRPLDLGSVVALACMRIPSPPGTIMGLLVAEPYPCHLLSVSTEGLWHACHRWLSSTNLFPAPQSRPVIAGVPGRFSEHLVRMTHTAMQRPVQLQSWDIWRLLVERDNVRNWSDDETVDVLDALILPNVYVELFSPETLLRMSVVGPGPEWWLTDYDNPAHPPVRTYGPVVKAVRIKVGAHLGFAPENVIASLYAEDGSSFGVGAQGGQVDQRCNGRYQVRIRFGGDVNKPLTYL